MKCEIMKKTNFTLNLKKEDTIAFAYLAAERGINVFFSKKIKCINT